MLSKASEIHDDGIMYAWSHLCILQTVSNEPINGVSEGCKYSIVLYNVHDNVNTGQSECAFK